jgi:hypothetical protein
MMIGSATAVVSYRGVVRSVPRDQVQPVTPSAATGTGDFYRQRAMIAGMPGAIVDLVA